jgi:hypothetical protein
MGAMQPGLHIVERARLASLAAAGVDVPEPYMGVLDVLRMVEGHLPEPPAGQALGVVGLDALLRAVAGSAVISPGDLGAQLGGDPSRLLQGLRTGFVEARRYFAWKAIPLVFLVDGTIDDPADDTGLHLNGAASSGPAPRWPLAPLLGTRLTPARAGLSGWWWAPQIG